MFHRGEPSREFLDVGLSASYGCEALDRGRPKRYKYRMALGVDGPITTTNLLGTA
jgi:hypothetical protein